MLHDELFRNTGDEEAQDLEDNSVMHPFNIVEQNIR